MATNQLQQTSITVFGVVLAGGQSHRMGMDKAILKIGTENFLQRSRKVLLEAGSQHVVLSGCRRDQWQDHVVLDLYAKAGPVSGIVSVVTWITSHFSMPLEVLIVPIDMSLLKPDVLNHLLINSQFFDGCIIAQNMLPLVLCSTPRVVSHCRTVMLRLKNGLSCSIKNFIKPLHINQLPTSSSLTSMLKNINTIQEWKNFEKNDAREVN
ncbi:MAG: NTP transferase domain-containing protein [Neisseriales bacterium]|nr:MAG: NTP transferase domain-containing protein [Neisseriales bacterium]